MFVNIVDKDDKCSINNIQLNNNNANITKQDMGNDDNYDIDI